MIPTHLLDNLAPDQSIAILSRGGEISFLVHPTAAAPDAVRAAAGRDGSEVLRTHLRDHAAIREFATSRERDTGGEG